MPTDNGLSDAIVETVSQPLLVLDADLRVVNANRAFCGHFQVSAEETEGALLYDLGNGQWDIPELRRLLGEVLPREQTVEDFRVEHKFETLGRRIMRLNARSLKRPGEPDTILLAISDVTEREDLLFELEGRKEFAEKLIDSIREGLLVLGWDLRVHSANQSFYEMFQVEPAETEGRLVYEIGNRQWDIPALRSLLEHVLPENNAFDDFEVEHEFERIGQRVMVLNGRRLDHQNLIVLAIRDITEERAARQRQELLTGELQHRVKNILNNVHALATQTRKRHESLDAFFDAFMARLDALARSQDLLVRSPTRAVRLRDVLEGELAAMGAEEGAQITVDGPAVRLPARDAQTVGLIVHELAMNAAKHGALAAPSGRIEVKWRVEPEEDGDRLVFDWRESGVRIETPNPRKGFGSQIIENSLPHLLGGMSELRIDSGGIACHFEFPLPPDGSGDS